MQFDIVGESFLLKFPRLLEMAHRVIEGGGNPIDYGLPALPDPNVILFDGRAVDPAGHVVAQVTVRRTVLTDEDWDAAEAAVRARLSERIGTPEASRDAVGVEEPSPPRSAPEPGVPRKAPKAIPPALLEAIRSLAAHHGREVPPFASVQEAKRFYRDLSGPRGAA